MVVVPGMGAGGEGQAPPGMLNQRISHLLRNQVQWKRSYKMRHLTPIITVGSVEPTVSPHLKLQVSFKPFCLNVDNLLKVLSCINVVMTGATFLI